MAEVALLKNGRVGYGNLRAKGRVGEQEIHVPHEVNLAKVGVPRHRSFQRVCLKQPACAVIVHHHAHLRGFH
jgi:hypothetical protein